MDPTTEDIFFSAEAFEQTSSAFATARGGMHLGKMNNQRQQQQQQQQRRSDRRQHQQMEDEDEEDDEDDGELSDMLLSDMDSGIFFNEASVAFFGGGGGGERGLQKYPQGGEGSGINTSKQQQQQQQGQEDEECPSPVPSFPHALLSSKNVNALPSTVHSGLSSFLAAGPPLWIHPAPGVSHHCQQQEQQHEQQQKLYGSQFQQSQQHNQQLEPQQQQQQQRQLNVSMAGFGVEHTGTGRVIVNGMQGREGGRKGKSESLKGVMDDTESILSSDSPSIWGVDPQDGRGGGSDNTIPPQYQMNHGGYTASSLMMMFPSPGSSSARSAVSGLSSGSNSGHSNSGNAAAGGAAAAAAGGADATLLPPGVVEKAKTQAAGGGSRRKLGGGSSGSSSNSGGSGGGGGGGGGSVETQAQALAEATRTGVDTTNVGILTSSGAEGGRAPNGKRKQDRNAREQKRSLKISQQIGHLKTVLEKEGRKVKKNSKMAILLSVEDYIKELEEEVAGMTMRGEGQKGGKEDEEAECGGFGAGGGICTMSAAAAAVAKRERERKEERNGWSGGTTVVTGVREGAEEREVASGVGYQLLFKQVSTPLAVASVDGKLIDANVRFEMASGYSKEELLRLTFFNLVSPEDLQTTFAAVARMINQGGEEDERVGGREEEPLKLTKRAMFNGRGDRGGQGGLVHITVSLVRQQGQNPSFFQCSLH